MVNGKLTILSLDHFQFLDDTQVKKCWRLENLDHYGCQKIEI